MFAQPPTLFGSAFQRVVAWLGVALVLVLGAAGVNTELHARVHGGAGVPHESESVHLAAAGGHAHDHAHADAHGHAHAHAAHENAAAAHQDEGCVIDLFAQGVAGAVDAPRVAATSLLGESLYQTVAEQAAPTKPAGWLPPVCGPPLK